jgi:hypothetical protein
MAKPLDSRAVRILFDTYWSSAGWKKERRTDPGDLEYAIKAGVMFPPVTIGHDALVANISRLAAEVDPQTVAGAFVASLGTRRLDWRSALGSYSFARNLPQHAFEPWEKQCGVCGLYQDRKEPEDLNVLNFERLKWGGVRHTDPLYAWLDLGQFVRLGVPAPTKEDEATFRMILAAIRAAPETATAPYLQKVLPKQFRSSKNERDVVTDILGLCGILSTAEHPGFLQRYTPARDRVLPPWRFVERAYPACWWRGKSGVNEAAAKLVFSSTGSS